MARPKRQLMTILTNQIIEDIEADEGFKQNQKFNLDYYSLSGDLLLDDSYQEKLSIYGNDYFIFHCYLKSKMLNSGRYYIFERNMERIIKNYCLCFNADHVKVKKVYHALLDDKMIFVLEDDRYIDGKIITDPFIVYNYLKTNDRRVQNREDQQNSRGTGEQPKKGKGKGKNKKAVTTTPVDQEISELENEVTDTEIPVVTTAPIPVELTAPIELENAESEVGFWDDYEEGFTF